MIVDNFLGKNPSKVLKLGRLLENYLLNKLDDFFLEKNGRGHFLSASKGFLNNLKPKFLKSVREKCIKCSSLYYTKPFIPLHDFVKNILNIEGRKGGV